MKLNSQTRLWVLHNLKKVVTHDACWDVKCDDITVDTWLWNDGNVTTVLVHEKQPPCVNVFVAVSLLGHWSSLWCSCELLLGFQALIRQKQYICVIRPTNEHQLKLKVQTQTDGHKQHSCVRCLQSVKQVHVLCNSTDWRRPDCKQRSWLEPTGIPHP